MTEDLPQVGGTSFEDLKQINQHGAEYWSARDLQSLLGYTQWRSFEKAIQKAVTSCEQSGNEPAHHFARARKMVVRFVTRLLTRGYSFFDCVFKASPMVIAQKRLDVAGVPVFRAVFIDLLEFFKRFMPKGRQIIINHRYLPLEVDTIVQKQLIFGNGLFCSRQM